jgi:hypothetical protein
MENGLSMNNKELAAAIHSMASNWRLTPEELEKSLVIHEKPHLAMIEIFELSVKLLKDALELTRKERDAAQKKWDDYWEVNFDIVNKMRDERTHLQRQLEKALNERDAALKGITNK